MKPSPFDYIRAASAEEAVGSLAGAGDDARILAGGLSLVPMLNFRLVEPSVLIDISGIGALDSIRLDNGAVEIGAATRQSALERWDGIADKLPLVHAAFPHIGHYQTRSRGTVCGSIAHSDPSSELPLCLTTLGGEVVLRSAGGERRVAAKDFQTGMLTTSKRGDEMVAAVRFPVAEPGWGYAFTEMTQRRGDFAIAALAAAVSAGCVRLGVGGVADHPTMREWDALEGSALDDALNAFAWDLGGYDDVHASARYRRELVRRLGRKVIEEARSCRS